MAREGIQKCGELGIRAVALPAQTDTYTVISHGYIIDKVREELAKNNFEIEKEDYSYSYGGQVVLCKVHIKSTKDPDMGMLFTWWNSYNKMVKFGCAVGGFIYDNNTSLIGSEGMSWIRKHTGTADSEATNIIGQLISQANVFFDKIIAEKERMKAMPLDVDMFGCIMGALYFELDLISPNQASAVKQEYKKPTNEYKDKNTLWGLYKLLMFGIDDMDLRKWANNQQKIHYTIMTTYASVEVVINQPIALTPETEELSESLTLTKEEVAYNLINEHGKDPAIVNYFCDEHFQNNLTLEQNVEAFFNYIKPNVDEFTAGQLSGVKVPEEIMDALINAPEVDASEIDMSNVTTVDAPDPTTLFTNESASTIDDVINDLSEVQEVVEVVETQTELPSGFEWLLEDDIASSDEIISEGLEIPEGVKELASKIEERMQELYGQITPYDYKETSKYCVVTISNTNEVFYI